MVEEMELESIQKIQRLHKAGCLTAKGAILMAARHGVVGQREISKHFGIIQSTYYRATRELKRDGLLEVTPRLQMSYEVTINND